MGLRAHGAVCVLGVFQGVIFLGVELWPIESLPERQKAAHPCAQGFWGSRLACLCLLRLRQFANGESMEDSVAPLARCCVDVLLGVNGNALGAWACAWLPSSGGCPSPVTHPYVPIWISYLTQRFHPVEAGSLLKGRTLPG